MQQRLQVFLQLCRGKIHLANGAVDNTGLIGAIANLTGLGVTDRAGDIGGHGADLGVRHQAARAEDLAELADDAHRIGGGNDHIKIHIAGLDRFGQVFKANDIGAGRLGRIGVGALGEYRYAHGVAGAIG